MRTHTPAMHNKNVSAATRTCIKFQDLISPLKKSPAPGEILTGQSSAGAEKQSLSVSCSTRAGSHSCLHKSTGEPIIAALLPAQVTQVPSPAGKDRAASLCSLTYRPAVLSVDKEGQVGCMEEDPGQGREDAPAPGSPEKTFQRADRHCCRNAEGG